MNVLIVAAHPDDEVLGCGATAAKLAQEGAVVSIAILGEGETSRGASSTTGQEVRALQVASQQAAEILGAVSVQHFQLPDNRLDTVPLLALTKTVEGLIESHQPEVVMTHFHGDLNIDHRLISQAVLTATRPLPGMTVREVLLFPVASSTEWAFGLCGGAFSPNVFYDVSAQWPLKQQALSVYSKEMRPFPHPRSIEAVDALARGWGACVGVERAEAFMLARSQR